MSLEGSLETIALPEVLQLLSDTSKSGELLVSGDRGDGRLWFDDGRLSGFDVQRCAEAPDAMFELLRAGSGRFSFEAGTPRPDTAHSVGGDGGEDIRPILEVAQAHLEEWAGIVAVVPSLDHRVALSPEAPSEKVELSAAQWSLSVVIGEGRSVGDVLDRAVLSEFEGCRSLKTLVEAGLVSVSEPQAAPEVVEPEPVAEVEPVVFEDEAPEPEAFGTESVAFDSDSVVEAPEVTDHSDGDEEVSAGSFDGQEFVFKAPAQPSDADYEPQPVPYPDSYSNGHVPFDGEASEGSDDESMTSRAALEALLAEIPADDSASDVDAVENGEVHDGLADRGPWTSQELASFDQMGGWQEGESASGHSGGEYLFSHADSHEVPTGGSSELQFEDAAGEHAEDAHGAAAEYDEPGEPEEEEVREPEPVNRGLLLKFLSSVRS